MLLRFKVENSRSFKALSELSLVQTSLQGPKVASKRVPQMADISSLPCALIYGANASGKSNFLKAFQFFRGAVVNSHRRAPVDGGVPRHPYRLTDDRARASLFEADFVVESVRYTYGFTCDDEKFLEEWLYSFPEGKRRTLYERMGSDVSFGSKFPGPKKALVDFMRPNSLFIATATQNDHPELSKLVSYLRGCGYLDYVAVTDSIVENAFKKKEVDKRVVEFLYRVGTGVVDFKSESMDLPEEVKQIQSELKSIIKNRFGGDISVGESDEDDTMVSIELGHAGEGGKTFFLNLDRESSGTRRLLLIMSEVFRALDRGTPLFIDELDTNLHTLAAEEIVKLFQSEVSNPLGAQLIATTHDTNLLSCKGLRRDQVWFCERDEEGASEIYSLAEIKSRKEDNFEKGYLEGRYGAIPYAGDLRSLFQGSR